MSAPIIVVALGLVGTLTQEGFDLVAEERGVFVHARKNSHAVELGAEGVIDASPDVVRAVLLDYESHPRWLAHLAESRVLRRDGDSLDVYQCLRLPIVHDRDFTIHVSWGDEADHKWLRFRTANDLGPPPSKGVVRVPLNEGSWRLYGVGGGRATWAVYRFSMDLGGSVPSWMGRSRATKDIVALFESIRNQTQYYRHAASH